MKVARYYDRRTCDNCEKCVEVYEISLEDGTVIMRLCHACLLKLLKALIERD